MKKICSSLLIIVLLCYLILYPEASLDATKSGLILWFDTLLPTLLPFLILTSMMQKTSLAEDAAQLLGPVFTRLFHIGSEGSLCMICGFLCGYPIGARMIADQLKNQKLTQKDSQYLLAFCNNVSPIFCISYGLSYGCGLKNLFPWLLILYGVPLLFGFLTRPKRRPADTRAIKQTSPAEDFFRLMDVCVIDSFVVMLRLCGCLILFSLLISLLQLIAPGLSLTGQCLSSAVLEITNALALIHLLPKGMLRTLLGVAALSFGGLCCAFQTKSVLGGTSLSIRIYLLHKLLITCLCLVISFLWLCFPFCL